MEYFLFEGKTGTCSDYASAYVLMARAVGLTVRYVEGFVPDMEYNGDYVIRTNNGHAYPEVYIENIGYVVYEATMPASYNRGNRHRSGLIAYLLTVVIRMAWVFAFVSAGIILVLFVHRVAAPYVKERIFLMRAKRAKPKRTIVMLYRRIQQKYTVDAIQNAMYCTPYEYAQEFERVYEQNINEWSLLMEKAAYTGETFTDEDKAQVLQMYQGIREGVKLWEKKRKKNK